MKIKYSKRNIIIGITGIIVLIIIVKLLIARNSSGEISFDTATVVKEQISNEVTATGTLEALKTVEVGTQVSGVISKIYVDFNTFVKKGQLLAELDKTPLMANLENAQASLDDANAEFIYQSTNYERIKALYDKALVAKADFDQATYSFSKAQAGLKVAKANFDKAKVNLGYATIYSPIDGVVLNRAVDEGQTVAASFNTPTLFSIANDLTRMQVEANIDEADIGQIKTGQKVEFNVDAFPELTFDGEVTQIRLQPVTVSNVVTYTVVVEAANPDKKLMPGMTANISITVENNDNALVIPYKALRFRPDSNLIKIYMARHELSREKSKIDKMHKPGNTFFGMGNKVWVKKGSLIHPVQIETGINNGTNIEVKKGLEEGEVVILGMYSNGNVGKASNQNTTNPFMPRPPSGRRK